MGKLQKYFLTGLLTLLPIWLVWIVFKFVFSLLSGISAPLIGPLMAGVAARAASGCGLVPPRPNAAQSVRALCAAAVAAGHRPA